ncbi:MAG: zf-HC2 domain-containing protein [Kiritimatiellaeota bacterium]|nr:zf-HC2 domain-containing protein [Kiritimatiellota bacterium]
MSCQDYQEQLTLYLLGDLEAGPAAQVCAHLETCAACRAAAGELERSLDLMRSAFVVSPAVPAQLDAAHRRRVLRAKFRWGPLPWQDLAKIAAVLLLSAGLLSALLLPAVKSARQKAMIIGRLGEVRGFRVATVRPSATEPDSSPSAVNHWGAGAEVDQRTTAQDSGVSRPGLDLKPTKETYLRPPEVSSKKPTWSMEVSRDAEKREGASGEQAALGDAVVSGGGILLANAERRHKSGRADAPDKQPDERVDPADRNQTTGKEAAGIAKGGSAVFLKNGSGTLTLNGVNTYSGSTTVSAGLQAGAGTVGKLVDGSGRDPTSGGQTGGDQFADNFNVAQSAMSAGGTMVPLRTTLPKPTMVGTPTQIRVQNLAAAEPHYAYAARAGGRETDSPPSPDRLKHDEKDKEKPPQSGDIPVTGRLFAEAPPPPTPQPETTPAVDDSRRARELYVAGEKSRGGGSGGGGSGGEAGGQDLARATLNWEGALDKRAPTARPQSHRSVSAKFAQTKEEADANGLVRTLDYAGWADRGGQQPGQQGGTDPKGEALWALRTAPPKTTELNKQLKEVSAESGIASLSDVTDSRTDTHRRFLPARAGEAKKLEDLQRSVDELRTLPAAAALPAPLTRPDGYVTGGDVTSFAAQGKAGHEALDYKEQDGRSNVGRAGLSDGEPAVAAGFFYGPGGAPAERLARKDMLAGKKSGKDLVVTDKLGGEFLGLRDSDKGTKTGSDTKPTGGGKSFGGGGPGDDAGGIDFAGAATGPLVLKGIGHGSYSGRLGGGNEIVRSKDDLVKLEGKDLVNGATFTDGNEKQQILRRQVADAQISLNLMRQALGDDNPDIQRLKTRLGRLLPCGQGQA